MAQHLRYLVIGLYLAMCLAIAGCASRQPRGDDVPLPTYDGLAIDYVRAENVAIQAVGIERYLDQYGAAGWLRGLRDQRNAYLACGDLRAAKREEGGVNQLRVKDVFANHYRLTRDYGIERFNLCAPVEQRDRQIDAFVNEVLENARAR